MSRQSAEPPVVPLRLTPREQWLLHHVLSERIDRRRLQVRAMPPPSEAVGRTLRKIESGSLLFTVPELTRTREALAAYRRTGDARIGSRDVDRLVDRIDDALARARPRRTR